MKIVLASVSFATPYAPQLRFLALGYLHAVAHEDDVVGPNTDIVHNYYDPSVRPPAQIAAAIADERPDVVGFTCYVWNAADVFRVCAELATLVPAASIILGGPEVSYHYDRVLDARPYVDFIAVGEGEHTFREFLRALVMEQPGRLATVAGLAQRRNGKPFLPAPRSYEKNLDVFPSPYVTGVFDVCDVRGGAHYQTARGCPFVCTYCDYGRNQPYFEFSMERVRAEFEVFKRRGATNLFNTDPTFNYSRKRAEGILQLGIDLDLRAIHWFEVFPTLINEDLIELVKDSYCSFIGCGIQTCTPHTMRNIRRIWRPEKVQPILDRLAGRPNVILSYEIIMGLPGDTLQNYKDSLSWTYARQPADIKAFNLSILPRTPLEKQVEQWGIEYDPDCGHEIVSTQDMTPTDVLVGKALNDWSKLLQSVLFRLCRIIDTPAGDLIESWAWRVHDAGLHTRIPELQVHRIPSELIEALAGLFEEFVAELCKVHAIDDVALQFRELFRYHFYRRSRTWVSALFAHVRDVYFNEPYAELHRVFSARAADLVANDAPVGDEVPEFGGSVERQDFAFDMRDLYATLTAADIGAVTPTATAYLFFTTPAEGAGCAIALDVSSRAFLAQIDGRRSVAEIAASLGETPAADLASRIYATLGQAGLFGRPRFLTEGEQGEALWHSSFPENKRVYR